MANYELIGNGTTIVSASQPVYDAGYHMWRCTDANGGAFNVIDIGGSAFTVTAPPPPAPTLAQQAQAMLAAGIQIVCTGTPALSGTYACDTDSLNRAGNLLAAIGAGVSTVPATIPWPDIAGNPHDFTAATIKELFGAMLVFEMQLSPLIAGAPGTLPTLPVTIP